VTGRYFLDLGAERDLTEIAAVIAVSRTLALIAGP
jgi:hypothetical protein